MSSIEGVEDPFGPETAGGTALLEREEIMESALTGEPVRALCGKVWTPGRDPQKFPVCPTCKEIYEGLKPGKDNSDNGDK